MGINPNRIYAAAWAFGLALAAIGGVMYAHFSPND
jgi:branched-chain amino acid transport system permease protein